ncbi:MAG: response regulator [bacterium]|nr:response regulator [bacterium]
MVNKTKVLVVDDTESVVASIAMILNDSRYDIVTADNGKEALEIINRERFDIIVSDYHMPPGMNGIGLLLNVRNNSRPEVVHTHFILMSGGSLDYSTEELEGMCTKHGAAFLKKPFSLTGLVALLEDAGSS